MLTPSSLKVGKSETPLRIDGPQIAFRPLAPADEPPTAPPSASVATIAAAIDLSLNTSISRRLSAAGVATSRYGPVRLAACRGATQGFTATTIHCTGRKRS